MGTRLFIALGALGAFIGLLAVKLLVDEPQPVQAADVGPSLGGEPTPSAGLDATVQSVQGDGTDTDPTRIGAASSPRGASNMTAARAAVLRGEDPEGFGVLIVEILLEGEPHDEVQVALRGESEPLMARPDTEPWAFYLPAKSSVVLDITDEESGWTQTETTLAPVAGDVRTLTVDLHPPQIDGEVLLQVRSEASGAPIGGAQVVAISEDPPDVVILETDGGGNARVPRGPGFSYVVNASGYLAASVPSPTESGKPFQIVKLRSFARLFGRIQTQGGVTTQVQLMNGDPDSMTDRHSVASASVDASGTWAIEGLTVPTGEDALDGLWIELESKGTTRTLVQDLRIEPGVNLEVIDPWISGLPITLEFVYPSGAPVVGGTQIFMRREAETEIGSGESVGGVASEDGRIDFPALYVGKWFCQVGSAEVPELVVTGDSLQTVVLEGYDCIQGNLRWADPVGQSFLGTRVFLRRSEGSEQQVKIKTITGDDKGQFRFDFIPIASTCVIGAEFRHHKMFEDLASKAFDTGKPIDVKPGAIHLTLSLKAAVRSDELEFSRQITEQPTLNFDK